MTTVLSITILALVAVAAASSEHREMFESFKRQYSRSYGTSEEEEQRFAQFAANVEKAQAMSEKDAHATFGVTRFFDMSDDEFEYSFLNNAIVASVPNASAMLSFSGSELLLPTGKSIDWRKKGAVTPVKNQEHCGSCWAFATTGNIEGQWFLAGNPLVSLSEQELVSCAVMGDACSGYSYYLAMEWLLEKHNGEIVTERSYPYTSGDRGVVPACKRKAQLSSMTVGAVISGITVVESSEAHMAAFVYSSGPLAVAVDARAWKYYASGVLTRCTDITVNHGVLITGFDDSHPVQKYWVIKNSWGSNWGEDGYIRIQKGKNTCLVDTLPLSATVEQA